MSELWQESTNKELIEHLAEGLSKLSDAFYAVGNPQVGSKLTRMSLVAQRISRSEICPKEIAREMVRHGFNPDNIRDDVYDDWTNSLADAIEFLYGLESKVSDEIKKLKILGRTDDGYHGVGLFKEE